MPKKTKLKSSNLNNQLTKDMSVNIAQIIRNNNIFVDEINQLLHNEGVEINNRLDIIIALLNKKVYGIETDISISKKLSQQIYSLIDSVSIDKDEIYQILFMFYCNKKTKINLDQYYTPFTIGKFISNLMIPGKKAIDPACGTGDLVKNYNGEITLWDVSKDVLDICEQNYKLNRSNYSLECHNTINEYDKQNNTFDYCCLNPPFGTNTVVKDKGILEKYQLGKGKKKQEIGILFIERAMNLLVDDGIAFIIVPNGYLGNSTSNIVELKKYMQSFKIISILELPSNTFSRSGTGVSTSLIIIQKTPSDSNNIFIKSIDNIGYILNRKNTPYKYKRVDGVYITENGMPILDDDLVECRREIAYYAHSENIDNIVSSSDEKTYETVNASEITDNILDIKRYLLNYRDVVKNCKKNKCKKISSFIEKKPDTKYTKLDDKEYIYLDIKQITTPIYSKSQLLYGYELPGRAKYKVNKYDIVVSKLKGKITFTIILDDADNIICTNGLSVMRPKDYRSAIILFANLYGKDFQVQHNSMCTGSIMETISETEIKNILIDENIDFVKYEGIINALTVLSDL